MALEQAGLSARMAPTWALPWTPAWTPPDVLARAERPRVAVLREEGSNGDREMAAALHAAGLEPWDVAMSVRPRPARHPVHAGDSRLLLPEQQVLPAKLHLFALPPWAVLKIWTWSCLWRQC